MSEDEKVFEEYWLELADCGCCYINQRDFKNPKRAANYHFIKGRESVRGEGDHADLVAFTHDKNIELAKKCDELETQLTESRKRENELLRGIERITERHDDSLDEVDKWKGLAGRMADALGLIKTDTCWCDGELDCARCEAQLKALQEYSKVREE